MGPKNTSPRAKLNQQTNIPSSAEEKKIDLPNLYNIQRPLMTKFPTTMSSLLYPPTHSQTEQLNWPLSALGLLKVDFGDNIILHGTATLIAPQIIITCAHNLYSHLYKRKAKSLTFLMNYTKGSALRQASITNFIYPDEYVQDKQVSEDYGICLLDSPIGEVGGYFGIVPFNQEENKNAFYYGYSLINEENENYEIQGVQMAIRYYQDGDSLIYIGISSLDGQDGSPLFRIVKDNYDCQLFAIDSSFTYFSFFQNSEGSRKESSHNQVKYHRINNAVPLSLNRYNQILRWINIYVSLIEKPTDILEESYSKTCSFLEGKDLKLLMNSHDFSKVTSLDLSNNSIDEYGIKQLMSCKELTNQLKLLNLSENIIDQKAAVYLSQCEFQNLTSLIVSINPLGPRGAEELSQGDFLTVTYLDLSLCELSDEGVWYLSKGNFRNATILKLEQNKIADEGIVMLSRSNMLNLKEIYLKSNGIGDEGIGYLSKYFFKKMTLIDIEFNHFTPVGLEILGQGTFSSITTLNVSNNKLSVEGPKIIEHFSALSLRSLHISRNDICSEGAFILSQSKTNLKHLEQLDISDNFICDMGLYHLCTGFLCELKLLNISLNQITEKGMENITKAPFVNLIELDISGNIIKDLGLKYLSFSKLKNIERIKVSLNNIESIGGKFLAQTQFNKLEELYIERNSLGALGLKLLLSSNLTWMIKLDISYNNIGDEGCELLSKSELNSLEVLNLKDNNITSMGATYLSQGNFKSLIELNLEDNEINSSGIKALSSGLLSSIRKLSLKGNLLQPKDIELIKKGNLAHLDERLLTFRNYSQINMSLIRQLIK